MQLNQRRRMKPNEFKTGSQIAGNEITEDTKTHGKCCCNFVKQMSNKDICKICLFIVLSSTLITIAATNASETESLVNNFLSWMKNNILLGSLAYIGVCIVGAMIAFPQTLLAMGAGFIFHKTMGTVKNLHALIPTK